MLKCNLISLLMFSIYLGFYNSMAFGWWIFADDSYAKDVKHMHVSKLLE